LQLASMWCGVNGLEKQRRKANENKHRIAGTA
jgi:hypothetical protein